jgi:hypothetical protein
MSFGPTHASMAAVALALGGNGGDDRGNPPPEDLAWLMTFSRASRTASPS